MSASTEQPHVLWRDGKSVAVIKPAGLSCERPGHDTASLASWACRTERVNEVWLPHRLDRMARGIVVLALSKSAAAFHAERVRERRWEKYYLARIAIDGGGLRRGWHASGGSEDQVRRLIGEHRAYLRTEGRRARVVRSGGQPSALDILAVEPAPRGTDDNGRLPHHALIRLHTGRFHQVRVMLAHLKAPIAGDPLYDPLAERNRTAPYLEHIVLRLPLTGDRTVTLHAHRDPGRDAIAPALERAVQEIVARHGDAIDATRRDR